MRAVIGICVLTNAVSAALLIYGGQVLAALGFGLAAWWAVLLWRSVA